MTVRKYRIGWKGNSLHGPSPQKWIRVFAEGNTSVQVGLELMLEQWTCYYGIQRTNP